MNFFLVFNLFFVFFYKSNQKGKSQNYFLTFILPSFARLDYLKNDSGIRTFFFINAHFSIRKAD